VRRGGSLDAPRIALRRFVGSAALDANDSANFMVSFPADQPHLSFDSALGRFLLGYRTTASDADADVRFATFSPNDLAQGVVQGLSEVGNTREAAPSLAASPSGETLGVFEISTPGRLGVRALTDPASSVLQSLADTLSLGGYDHGSIIAGPNGFWVSWSGTIPGRADQCSLAFSVPYGASE
jgi:hypothetical protein